VVDAPAHQLHLTRRLVAGIDHPVAYRAYVEMLPGEAAWLRYVEALRWQDGFVCPACGSAAEPWRASRDRLVSRAWRHSRLPVVGTTTSCGRWS